MTLSINSDNLSYVMTELKLKNPFIIIGLGKSGLAAENLLLKSGCNPDNIFTFDEKSTVSLNQKPVHFKSWPEIEKFCQSVQSVGTFVLSPGVPRLNPTLQSLVKSGWTLTSEINLACAFLKTEKIIGITGSVGKSTVTSLLGVAAQHEDINAFVGGNLGTPFCQYACDLIDGRKRAHWVILELSSYQLENCSELQLDWSAVTFLSANHLERYSSITEYYNTKLIILNLTKNGTVLNKNSADAIAFTEASVFKKTKTVYAVDKTTSSILNRKEKIQLLGSHNADNFAVAEKLAELAGFSKSSVDEMKKFTGLEHRLESVGIFNEILFINDSKATAMDSVQVAVQAALEKITSTGYLYLLLGGKDKNLPWHELSCFKNNSQIKPVFFGQCKDTAKQKSTLSGNLYSTMEEALQFCFFNAQPGDVVLLSPGGTSLDAYKNFEDRGRKFKSQILNYYSKK